MCLLPLLRTRRVRRVIVRVVQRGSQLHLVVSYRQQGSMSLRTSVLRIFDTSRTGPVLRLLFLFSLGTVTSRDDSRFHFLQFSSTQGSRVTVVLGVLMNVEGRRRGGFHRSVHGSSIHFLVDSPCRRIILFSSSIQDVDVVDGILFKSTYYSFISVMNVSDIYTRYLNYSTRGTQSNAGVSRFFTTPRRYFRYFSKRAHN